MHEETSARRAQSTQLLCESTQVMNTHTRRARLPELNSAGRGHGS